MNILRSRLPKRLLALLATTFVLSGGANLPAEVTRGVELDSRSPLMGAATWIGSIPDTVGLGARIAATYPEYRLSTEDEILSRFPYQEVSPEEMWGPRVGTGALWWVARSDINGDGRQDIVTVLTAREDASQDLLAVFFGNGSAADLGRLGGNGFAVSVEDGVAWIYMVYGEKGSDRYRWNGSAFEEDQDRCCE
jgi:hypothetical protein